MDLHLPRRRGATRLERVLALVLFAGFVGIFLDRMSFYQEYAEKTAMELTAAHIRAGMRSRVAELILANRAAEIARMADDNPINFLDKLPYNYAGEFDSAPPGPLAGKWYYDRQNRELVYSVNNRRHFASLAGANPVVRFQTTRVSVESGNPQNGRDVWVKFGPKDEYRWQP